MNARSHNDREIDRMKSDLQKRRKLAIKRLAFGLFRDIVLMSPVNTGRFRANWALTLGSPDLTAGPADLPSYPRPQIPLSELGSWEEGETIYIANGVPYGPRLEDGWSDQAPQGMVRLSILRQGAVWTGGG